MLGLKRTDYHQLTLRVLNINIKIENFYLRTLSHGGQGGRHGNTGGGGQGLGHGRTGAGHGEHPPPGHTEHGLKLLHDEIQGFVE